MCLIAASNHMLVFLSWALLLAKVMENGVRGVFAGDYVLPWTKTCLLWFRDSQKWTLQTLHLSQKLHSQIIIQYPINHFLSGTEREIAFCSLSSCGKWKVLSAVAFTAA